MTILKFLIEKRKVLAFGLLLTFFSSFGQTFLVSLYVPDILEYFDLTKSSFGSIYSLATVLSGFTIVFVGKQIDQRSLKSFTLFTALGLTASTFLISFAHGIVMLFISLAGLRLFGQGLLSLIAQTTMARSFDVGRGKALSIAMIGYPLGEAFLPIIITALIGTIGWRWSWGVSSMFILIALVPYVLFASKEAVKADHKARYQAKKTESTVKQVTQLSLFKDPTFLMVIWAVLMAPFLLTALLLYQVPMAEMKGWSAEWIATSFIGFAVARIIFSLTSGLLVDRFSARILFPFYLIPLFIGVFLLTTGNSAVLAPIYLFLLGVSAGAGGSIKSAMWAELYGVAKLGAVKSLAATLMILSTAAAPFLMGYLLEIPEIDLNLIFYGVMAVVALSSILSGIGIYRKTAVSG